MQFYDSAPVQGTRRTADGYLVAEVRTARTGLQTYTGAEAGRPSQATVTLFRPENEVFSHDSKASYAHKPITVGHPPAGVSAENWRKHAVGHIGDTVSRDGEFIRVPMVLMDAGAVAGIANGTREVSAGYICDIDWTPGRTADGRAYDGVQRRLRINHVAVVPRGRAGPECRFGDSASTHGNTTMTTPTYVADAARQYVADYGDGADSLLGFSERVKALYALGDAKSNEVYRVEQAAQNLRSLAARASMTASGQSRALFGDSAENSLQVAAFLTRMADQAQGRADHLRSGGRTSAPTQFEAYQQRRISDAQASGNPSRVAYEISNAERANAWKGNR